MTTMFRRGILESIDATGAQHKATLTGIAGEKLFDVPRIKEFGFSSSPPPGSMAQILALYGRSDNAMVLGLDHKDHGPRDLGAGHVALYDAYGSLVSLVQTKVRIVSSTLVEIVAPNIVLNGNVTLGGALGSGVPVSRQGTTDTGGNTDNANFATKVKVV